MQTSIEENCSGNGTPSALICAAWKVRGPGMLLFSVWLQTVRDCSRDTSSSMRACIDESGGGLGEAADVEMLSAEVMIFGNGSISSCH